MLLLVVGPSVLHVPLRSAGGFLFGSGVFLDCGMTVCLNVAAVEQP